MPASRGAAMWAAVVGLVLAVARPLLPIYGNGGQFLFAVTSDWRIILGKTPAESGLTAWLGLAWTSALAILVGIFNLNRTRSAVAGGVFVAVAIVVAGAAAITVATTSQPFADWRMTVVIALQAAEAVALAVAASIAVRRWA